MAVIIISAQLNTYGGNGHFETDRSTWGTGDPLDKVITRSPLRRYADNYAALVRHDEAFTISQSTGVFCRVPVPPGSVGKKFLCRAKVYIPTIAAIGIDPIAGDTEIISIAHVETAYNTWNPDLLVTKTVLEAKNTWVEISGVVEIIQDFFLERHVFSIEVSGAHVDQGGIFVDEFEVYEVEVNDDPEPTCTIDLAEDSTTVTNESAPSSGNGSIAGAATGGGGVYEWKLDAGSWQSSNLFSGLSKGIYTLHVRDQANPDCTDNRIFAVNDAAIAFDFTIDITNETIAGASNGAAVLTPSGTGAPFTYSNDGGETFQSGNSFSDLAPGEYAFIVKDTNGNSLVKYATVGTGVVLFEKAFFSKNPIPFSVNAEAGYEAKTNYRIYCDTRVEEEAGSGVFVSKLKQELPADTEGKAVFSLRPAFRNEVGAIVPNEPTASMVKLTDRLKWYKNYVGHLENEEVAPESLIASNPFIVVMGGVGKYHYPTLDYLTTYLQAKKKFLTWAPLVKNVTRQQEDYLNFFVYSPATTLLKLRVKVYFDDDTNETEIHGTIACKYGELYQIPAGTSNTSVLTVNPAKNPIRYELSLLDQTDSLISEVRTYKIDRVTHPRTRYLMFLNSLGSFEVHRFTGQTNIDEQYTREVVHKFLPHDYHRLDGEAEINDVHGQRTHTFSSGYFTGVYAEAWLDYMRDLMRTTRFYDVTSGERMPMLVLSTSMALKEDQNYRRFVRFAAQEVYMNENYTPDEV